MKRFSFTSITLLTLSISLQASTYAQSVASTPAPAPVPAVTPDPHALARDTVDHDPTRGTGLALDFEIKQSAFAQENLKQVLLGGPVTKAKLLHKVLRDFYTHRYPNYRDVLSSQPEMFDLLKLNESRYQPDAENGPALINSNFEYAGISDRKRGFCWGIATLVRNFTVLAFFDAEAPKDSDEILKEKIDTVMNGDVAVFNGYGHFRELSSVPEIELYLKLKVMEAWRRGAMRAKSIGFFLKSSRAMQGEQISKLLSDLEERLARHEFPKLMFSSKVLSKGLVRFSKYMHVVLANRVERRTDGTVRIYIWDGNFYAETLMSAPKYIEVNQQGELIYDPWLEPNDDKQLEATSIRLNQLLLAPENNSETVRHLFSLKKFCEKSENKKWCSKNETP